MTLSPLPRRVRLLLAVSCACVGLSANPPRPTSDAAGPAYLLLALPSHRVIAESRRDVLATPIAPGSVMKVVTLAAALEHGAADAATRILCRRTIDVDGRPLTCVHPDFHRALDPVEAIAHSCNVFFATIARRLPRSALDDMLVRVGLAPSNPGTPLVTTALGLGGVRATPQALLDAFCRLADVGRPGVQLKDETRRLLRLGLESAARTGTASALAEAGYSGLAKTGTAPMPGGGYQGLVAAVVNTELPTHAIVVVAPGSTGAHAASLAANILIEHRVPRRIPAGVRSLPPSSAGEGASVRSAGFSGARKLLSARAPGRPGAEEVTAAWSPGPSGAREVAATWSPGPSGAREAAAARGPGPSGAREAAAAPGPGPSGAEEVAATWNAGPSGAGSAKAQVAGLGDKAIRVGIARRTGGYDAVDMPIEDYVARAVAGEGGDVLPTVALEALAVTVRTYAWANGGRHRADGFDVCDLTHCLSLRPATAVSRAAARSTAELILTALGGSPADVYLSAWCGGHTERPSQVWAGAVDHAYLPAQRDPACGNDPGWTSEITEPQLRGVLEAAGLRGAIVRDLRVGTRSTSGRVRTLLVDGMRLPDVEAGAFRFAAGRVLGWQTIKSTLFDVVRTGTGFRFTGKGSGHGVGLCVRGAAARARMGGTKEQILAAYFPGLSVGIRSPDLHSLGAMTPGLPPKLHVVLPEADLSQLRAVRTMAERALAELVVKLGVGLPPNIEIRFHPTVEAYTRATGQPWWTSARTGGTRVDLLPLRVLTTRGIVETTLKHECVHVLTEATLAGRPLWVREGLAAVLAGEFAHVTQGGRAALARDVSSVKQGSRVEQDVAQDVSSAKHDRDSRCPSDTDLRDATTPGAWRRAYEAAAACVSRALASGHRWQDLR